MAHAPVYGDAGSPYTDDDYAAVQDGMDACHAQLLDKGAAESARVVKDWLAQHRPGFMRSWRSIMSHTGPPGVINAETKNGVVTRAMAARNTAEARANLEANRAADQAKKAKEAKEAQDKKIAEMKKAIAAEVELGVQLQVRLDRANQDAAGKEKKALALREENDKLLGEKERALERAALAEAAAAEAQEREEKAKKEAENERRLKELSNTAKAYYENKAAEDTRKKQKLATFLREDADRDAEREMEVSNGLKQIRDLLDHGEHEQFAEAHEALKAKINVLTKI